MLTTTTVTHSPLELVNSARDPLCGAPQLYMDIEHEVYGRYRIGNRSYV